MIQVVFERVENMVATKNKLVIDISPLQAMFFKGFLG